MKAFFFVSLSFVFGLSAFGLDIDEKLTLRVLSISESKKTMLLNRGSEDGVVESDHAKFFLSAGVVARGVAVKVSPGRSIWSLYRIVDSEGLDKGKVLGLKATPAVKLTNDPTKMLPPTSFADNGPSVKISGEDTIEEGLPLDLQTQNKKNTDQIASQSSWKAKRGRTDKSFALGAAWAATGLSAESATEDNAQVLDGDQSLLDWTFSFELSFPKAKSGFLRSLSFGPIVHYSSRSYSVDNADFDLTHIGIGGRGKWYFLDKSARALSPYIVLDIVYGINSWDAETSLGTQSASGNSYALSPGIGAEYAFQKVFSVTGRVDYYFRREAYEFDDGTISEVDVSGPRLSLGLLARF